MECTVETVVEPITKMCTKCGVEKPVTEFGKDASRKGGYYIYCRECVKTARDENKLHVKPIPDTKIRSGCGIEKSIANFSKKSISRDGYNWDCRACTKTDWDNWSKVEENRQYIKAEARKRNANRRDIVIGHYSNEKFICACLGCGENTREFLCLDHINGFGNEHSRSLGGSCGSMYNWVIQNNFPDMFQVLCFNCNFAKSAHKGCPHTKKSISEYAPFLYPC